MRGWRLRGWRFKLVEVKSGGGGWGGVEGGEEWGMGEEGK